MGTQLLLDGRSISSEADFHDVIDKAARAVGFEGYGRNLDALWDVLTGFLETPVEARWINAAQARTGLGPRFEEIVSIFREADRELGNDFRFEMQQ
jgi:ribonuclease inhibitor